MRITPERFVAGFVEPFLDQRFDVIADMYEHPMLFIRPDGSRAFWDRETFSAEASKVHETYAERGLSVIQPEHIDTRSYTRGFYLVDMRWSYVDRRAHEIAGLYTTHLLRAKPDGFSVVLHISHTQAF